MNIAEYILQLLKQNNRVIIPELGAFIIKQRKPQLIVFNEFLQYNDGMLIDAISKNENIDRNEAKAKIDQLVESIKASLAKGDVYPFEELGVLMKSPSGKISFGEPNTVWNDSNIYIEKEIALETEEPITPVEKVDIVPPIVPEQTEESLSEPAETVQEEISVKKVELEKPVEVKIPEHKPEKEDIHDYRTLVNDQKAKESSEIIEIQKPYSVSSETKVNHQPSSTRKKSIIIWTTLIVLVNIAIVYFYLNNSFSGLFKKEIEKLEPIIVTDSIEKTEIPSSTVIDTTPITQETIAVKSPDVDNKKNTKVSSGKRYFIVAGVFRNEENADKMVTELRKKGFNPEKFGKVGELYGVSYDVFTSKADAQKALVKIKSETNPGAWIKTFEN